MSKILSDDPSLYYNNHHFIVLSERQTNLEKIGYSNLSFFYSLVNYNILTRNFILVDYTKEN